METANQAMEEKAKALATARLRYKQDIKTLSEKFQEASTRREQVSFKIRCILNYSAADFC